LHFVLTFTSSKFSITFVNKSAAIALYSTLLSRLFLSLFALSNSLLPPLHTTQAVETALTPWLQGLNPDALLYDKTYGGVITTNGVADLYADYGSGWYSDHHFHYGYFAYAAATLAKLDVPYWEANKIPMETIIRDFCNPDPTDPDFPFARHKDFFDGHSWASGLYPQANGKGQESSSEVR
jgi:endoglucanase Acf2